MTEVKTQPKTTLQYSELLQRLIEEIRLLRNEMLLILPSEKLEDYSDSHRLKKSYEKAIKRYPPVSL
ncbi:hypothetical protein HYV91_00600 [Candidatus Wolfebacteria bacterium]|nr:hypothetical protein [Candidatus Wolfebacteria bacterium]